MARLLLPKALASTMSHMHVFTALFAGWPIKITLGLAAVGFVLPDPARTLSWLGAVATPAFVIIATGYVVFLSKVTPARIEAEKAIGAARIEAEKAFDAAHRETNMGKLAAAQVQIEENKERLETLERDLHEERIHSARLREDVEQFAILVLSKKGVVTIEDDGRAAATAAADRAEASSPTGRKEDCP